MKNLQRNGNPLPTWVSENAPTVRQRLADHFTSSTFSSQSALSTQLGLPQATFRASLWEELGQQFTLSIVQEGEETNLDSMQNRVP